MGKGVNQWKSLTVYIIGVICLFSFSLCRADEATYLTEESPPLVTCALMGQLGNQIFQIATTLAYAWDHGAIALFPDLNKPDWRLDLNRDAVFFRLDASPIPRPLSNQFYQSSAFRFEPIPAQRDLNLIGYFQTWKYFDHHRDKLLSVLAPSQSILDYIHEVYENLVALPNTVSVHVRTFNKWLHETRIHPFMGMEYYKDAMNQFPPETVFVIFSDRITWCKKHFSKLGKQCVFIEEKNWIVEFFLMSMMKNHIICNSSFSWWAAYLNQNPDQTVIAPDYWMHPHCHVPQPQHDDIYLPHWTVIPRYFN